jgi:hypothetical protein
MAQILSKVPPHCITKNNNQETRWGRPRPFVAHGAWALPMTLESC